MTINERVHELRKDILNLTMAEFGRRLGVSKAAISNIESGTRGVTDQMFASICREFHVSEEWLRDGVGDPFVKLDPEDELMIWAAEVLSDEDDNFRRRFVRMLAGLTVDEWELLEKKLRELFPQ